MGHKVKQALMSSRIDFFYYAFRNVLVVSVPLLVISTFILGFSVSHSSATNSGSGSDNLTITISSACTLSSVVDSEHSTNTNVGTYTSDIGKTTITTLCNDGNGYSVYAVGYSNNEEGNNKLINSERPEYSIDTGLNTSGLTSQWAMKLNNIPDDPSPTPPTIESNYNNVYGIVPPYWTKVAGRSSSTTDMAEGSSFTTTYAVYASSSQYAGTYNGQVKYLLTHPSYKPAVYYMQEVDKWKNTIALEESVQAIDMRDGKKYWVTKLKDGNIWMTQNLDFNINTNTALNSQTTDLNVTYNPNTGQYAEYNNGYTESNGVIYWKPASSATTIDFTGGNGTAVPNWQDNSASPYSANKTDSIEVGHTSFGNYYNWTAAIASNNSSSLTQDTLNDISKNPKNSICPKGWRLPTISSESETLAGSTNEFARLNYLYNSNQTDTNTGLVISPVFLLYTQGRIYSNMFGLLNQTALYLSSTNSNISNIYRLVVSTTSPQVLPTQQANDGRKAGSSIRCVAR